MAIELKPFWEGGEPEAVLPIPLHPRRLRKRGVSAPLILAKALARSLKLPLRVWNLDRVRNTPEQAGLKRKERRRNLKGAFQMRHPLKEQRLLLIDDVLTTGTTLDAASAVLKRAGALEIFGLSAARVDFD